MSLMWRMTKMLLGTSETVMMDSGLCLLKLLVVMYDRGVYCGAVVNKRRY